MNPLATLHSVAENKPGSHFTSRDAQAIVDLIDRLTDAIIHLGGRSRKAATKAQITYEAKIRAELAEILRAKAE